MRTRSLYILLTIGLCSCWIGCTSTGSSLDAGGVTADSLVAHLQDQGISLHNTGPVTQSLLNEQGRGYTVTGGGELHIYEYNSVAAASLDANAIDRRVLRGTEPPHLYRRGRLIVLYFGDYTRLMHSLADLLGPQEL